MHELSINNTGMNKNVDLLFEQELIFFNIFRIFKMYKSFSLNE